MIYHNTPGCPLFVISTSTPLNATLMLFGFLGLGMALMLPRRLRIHRRGSADCWLETNGPASVAAHCPVAGGSCDEVAKMRFPGHRPLLRPKTNHVANPPLFVEMHSGNIQAKVTIKPFSTFSFPAYHVHLPSCRWQWHPRPGPQLHRAGSKRCQSWSSVAAGYCRRHR